MSGISGTGSSTAGSSASTASSVQYGDNVPPISFPGIASGIDYNSIISQYTSMTMAQAAPVQAHVSALNAQEQELLKIQDLVSKFQDTFTAVSNPAGFIATSATSSAPGVVSLSDASGQSAVPGAYTIQSATMATATSISNDPAANATINPNAALLDAGFAVTPQDGTDANGNAVPATLTIDGVQLTADVNSQTLANFVGTTINGNAQLQALGVHASFDAATGALTISSTGSTPLTIGSASDVGNLAQVFGLANAPIASSGSGPSTTYTVTSTGSPAGIDPAASFSAPGNAGYATAVSGGVFTINGAKITVTAADNTNDVISAINASSAGVLASYDAASGHIVLTNQKTGSSGIALGSASDSSNFLQAAGFLSSATQPGALSAGATQIVGQPAAVTYLDQSGQVQHAYSASNDVTNVISGIDIQLQQSTNTPFTIDVAADSSGIQTDIGNFVTAYNNLINELNTATAPPVVGSSSNTSTGQQQSQQLTAGGVLYGDSNVQGLRDQLVELVSNIQQGGSSSYNSLASIGLQLDSSFSVGTASSSSSSNGSTSGSATNSSDQTSLSTQTYAGTSGQLAALDTSTFSAALAANPNAVASLFTGTSSIIGQLGSYLTGVSGLPTQLTSGLAGTIPQTSLFASIQQSDDQQISTLQQQIQTITDQANMQADMLRTEFSNSESQIATLQAEQSSLSSELS